MADGDGTKSGGSLAWILRLWVLLAIGIVLADISQNVDWGNPGQSAEPRRPPAPRTASATPNSSERPVPGDQMRPYRPGAFPVGPDGRLPRLPNGEVIALPDGPMTLSYGEVEGRPALIAAGMIDATTPDKLREADLRNDERAEILVLLSTGGQVDAAMRMGNYVRSRALETYVPEEGVCASACPLVLAAGDRRRVARSAWIGLHQPYLATTEGISADVAVFDVQNVNYEILTSLEHWGVDPRVWTFALGAPPSEMYVLTPEELVRYRLAHSVF